MDGENGGLATFSYSIRRKEKPPVCQKQKELHSLRLWVFLSFLFRRSLTRPVTEFFLSSVSVLFPNCLFAWDSAGSRLVCGGQKGWSRCVRCRTASPGRLSGPGPLFLLRIWAQDGVRVSCAVRQSFSSGPCRHI